MSCSQADSSGQWHRKALPVAAMGILALAAFGLTYGYYIDDMYIYGQFARNFARGLGFTYHEASGPTYGMTGPLFVVLLAPFASHGAAACHLGAKLLGLLATFGAMWSLAALCNSALGACGRGRWLGFGAAAVAVLSPCTMRWMVCGMETPLALLCVCEIARAILSAGNARWAGARIGVWTSIGLFVRPEFVVVYAIVVLLLVLAARFAALGELLGGLRQVWRDRLATLWLVVPAGLYALWLLYAWTTFGQIQPNTVLAKGGAQTVFSSSPLLFLGQLAVQGTVLLGVPLAAVAVFGVVHIAVRRSTSSRGGAAVLVLGLFTAGILFGYYARNAPVSGRYLAMFVPALAGAALAHVWRLAANRSGAVLASLSAVVVVGSLVPLPWVARHMRLSTVGNKAMHAAGGALRAAAGPDDQIVAADVGVIAYASERDVVDIVGLVSPQCIHDSPAEVILRSRPRYFVLRGYALRKALGQPPRLDYRIIERFHFPSLKLRDTQGDDYLVGQFVYPRDEQQVQPAAAGQHGLQARVGLRPRVPLGPCDRGGAVQ